MTIDHSVVNSFPDIANAPEYPPLMSVLVVGSANMDLVFRTARMPSPGETLLGGQFATHPGGKGANQAVAIGRLGGAVSFVGKVGSDAFGVALRQSLTEATVNVDFLQISEAPTGTAGIFVDDAGQNMIVVAPGANAEVSAEEVRIALQTLRPSVTLAQLEIPLEAVLAAAQADRFILNPAPARQLPDDLLDRCFALTPNEFELQALTGIDSTEEAAKRLLDRGVQNVIVTLGEQGSYWVSASGGLHFPVPLVSPIDTTGAGDAFNGALAMFLAEGQDLANAIPLANCVGALATTRPGAQEAMPTRKELRALAGSLY
jgi:ribokinase